MPVSPLSSTIPQFSHATPEPFKGKKTDNVFVSGAKKVCQVGFKGLYGLHQLLGHAGKVSAIRPPKTRSTDSSKESPVILTARKIAKAIFTVLKGVHDAIVHANTVHTVKPHSPKPILNNKGHQLALTHQFNMKEVEGEKPYFIIGIDGGGLRGIIPAVVLKKIEAIVGRSLTEVADCFAGTSTGGIIALGLTKQSAEDRTKPQFKAADVPELYKTIGKDIFKKSFCDKFNPFWGLFSPKYSGKNKRDAFSKVFKDAKVQDSLTDVVITSYDMVSRKAVLFTKSGNEKVVDVLDGTTAAPTFFRSVPLNGMNLVDGGLAFNNPAAIAATEAVKTGRRIVVFSIGTGHSQRDPIKADQCQNWGELQWVKPLIHSAIDSHAQVANLELNTLANKHKIMYVRFQINLKGGLGAMDNPNIMPELEKIADKKTDEFTETHIGKSLIAFMKGHNV